MKEELQNQMYDRFPHMFRARFRDFHSSGMVEPMVFGITCDDGWFGLIWKLCEDIEPLVDEDFYITQVKEKFGGLRFYTMFGMNISEMIRDAEEDSYHICEVCGKPGLLCVSDNWYKTVCKKHRKREKYADFKPVERRK